MFELLGPSALCFIGALVVLGLFLLSSTIRIVPQNQRLVVFRLGRELDEKGPGLVLVIPIIDRVKKIGAGETTSQVGVIGLAKTDIHALGKVKIKGELWDAYGAELIPFGSRVRAMRKEGSIVVVEKF